MSKTEKKIHHRGKKDEKHTKRFLKAYAPYLPLIMIVGFGLFLSTSANFRGINGSVLSYATNMTDSGLLDSTNAFRSEQGLKPLKFNVALDEAAQAKAQDMASRNYWSHNTPDGDEPWVFIDRAGYKYYKAAENLAYGFDDSKSALVGWMNSPAHKANVMDPQLTEVGFGIINVDSYQNKGNETIVVAMYGLPPPEPLTLAAGSEGAAPIAPSPQMAATSAAPESKNISYAQMLTGGATPWVTLFSGILIGLLSMYLVLKHAHGIVKTIKNGEKFVLRHPLLDTTIIALVALATVVAQTAGTIH